MLASINCVSKPVISRRAHTRPSACPALAPRRRVVRVVSRPQATASAGSFVPLEPFVGCNCYYLLEKAIIGETDYVRNTLWEIKKAGFNVIRMWAFSDGQGGNKLQTAPGDLDPKAMRQFDWLMDEVEKIGGLKLMMCLTNGVNTVAYGGMQQYVRWAKFGPSADAGSNDFLDEERFDFYTNDKAKQYYRTYVEKIVKHYKDRSCIHSWDICNEPRNSKKDAPSDAIASWVNDAAGLVKSLDNRHPVTVGSEGFFGPAPPGPVDLQSYNPGGASYGCNWLREAQSPNIDFVCIHPYANDWLNDVKNEGATYEQWEKMLQFNQDWIKSHVDACRDHLHNKPLVLQEYNLPCRATSGRWPECPKDLRLKYHQYVKEALLAGNTPLKGAMVWMVAADGTYPNDGYTLNPYDPAYSEEWNTLRDMCSIVNKSLVVV